MSVCGLTVPHFFPPCVLLAMAFLTEPAELSTVGKQMLVAVTLSSLNANLFDQV